MSKNLSGKVALVTGGSRGIGAATARKLASQGADVAISYSASPDKAKAVVADLEKHGVRAAAFQADQADATQVAKLVDDVVARFGKLDILVNNAGVFVTAGAEPAAYERQYAINVRGVTAAVEAAIPHLKEGARIINLGSVLGERSLIPGVTHYAATKGAVALYSRGLARDLGSKNITVNTVQPGPIDTDMNPDGTEMAEATKPTLALGRYGKPEEVAAAIAFLASPEASFITGTELTVDGGAIA
ncbi:MAG: SDR family oxidoreductase [Verrucomicrobium sp.]|nr:SDR family oxidoreductase [Verrucomicrobium sp.]